jgi:hypothetical protein
MQISLVAAWQRGRRIELLYILFEAFELLQFNVDLTF